MKTIAVTIDVDLVARMDRLGDRNRSLLVREAVAQYVARREREMTEAAEDAVVRRHRRRISREAAALVRAQGKR